MKRIKPYTATEKLAELNRLELGTKSLAILFDCSPSKASQIKKQVIEKILASGKILPSPDKVPTTTAIKYLHIDESRLRRLAEYEKKEMP